MENANEVFEQLIKGNNFEPSSKENNATRISFASSTLGNDPNENLPSKKLNNYTLARFNKRKQRANMPEFSIGVSDSEQRIQLKQLLRNLAIDTRPKIFDLAASAYAAALKLSEPHRTTMTDLISEIQPFENMIDFKKALAFLQPSRQEAQPEKRGLLSIFASEQKKERLTPQHPIFNKLNLFLQKLNDAKNKFSKLAPELVKQLNLISGEYQTICQEFCDAPLTKRICFLPGSPLIYGYGLDSGAYLAPWELRADIAAHVFPLDENGELRKLNSEGTHPVHPIGGIHFKVNPDAPGIEAALDCLNKTILEQGSTPSSLYRAYYKGKNYIVLASKTVEGKLLSELLSSSPEFIKKIDPDNFSAQIALGLIGRPQDAKGANFIGSSLTNETSTASLFQITNIDQDMGLSISIAKVKEDFHTVEHKNILYFFPQMKQEVGTKFRNYLSTVSPAVILLNWLKLLLIHNQNYEFMRKQHILTDEDMQRLGLPIKFRHGTLEQIYADLKKIISLCQREGSLTNQELFEAIDPVLSALYKEVKEPDIMDAYGIISSSRVEDLIANSENPLLKSLDLTAYQETPQAFGDRQQTIEGALEELISAIEFKGLSDEHQQDILNSLIEFKNLNELHLQECTGLDDEFLKKFARNFHELNFLLLKKCSYITERGLAALADQRPNLTLTVSRSKYIANKKWPICAKEFFKFNLLLDDGFVISMKNADKQELNAELVFAAQSDSSEGVKFLLQLGADSNAADKTGYTSLHYAAQNGQEEIINALLLTSTTQIDYQTLNQGMTALHIAAESNQFAAAKLLLENHADPFANNIEKENVFHIAARNASKELCKLILSYAGADNSSNLKSILMSRDESGKTILHHAVFNPDITVLHYWLELGKELIDEQDEVGNTPLHLAVSGNLIPQIQVLVVANTPLTLRNKGNFTPLDIVANAEAIIKAEEEKLKKSLEAKLADKYKDNKQALEEVVKNETDNYKRVEKKVYKQIVECLSQDIYLLATPSVSEISSQPTTRPTKNLAFPDHTPAHQAIINEDFEKLSVLLNVMPDLIYATNKDGNTLLHLLAKGINDLHYEWSDDNKKRIQLEKLHIDTMEMLINKGADLEARNKYEETPLNLAAQTSRSLRIISYLMQKGARIDAIDDKGDTCLHKVMEGERNQYKLTKYIVENGGQALIKTINKFNFIPLHKVINPLKPVYPDQKATFNYLIKHLTKDIKRLLPGMPSSLDYFVTSADETLLHMAVRRLDIHMVNTIIKFTRFTINNQALDGNTALHYAVTRVLELSNEINDFENQYQVKIDEQEAQQEPWRKLPKPKDAVEAKRLELAEANYLQTINDLLTNIGSRRENIEKALEIIDILLATGAKVGIKNNKAQTVLSLAQAMPFLYAKFAEIAKREKVDVVDATKEIKRFLQNNLKLEKEFKEKIRINPLPGFSLGKYQEYFDRYSKIYQGLETNQLVTISERTLLRDLAYAQNQSFMVYPTPFENNNPQDKQIAEARRYHNSFFAKISMVISDYGKLQRELKLYHEVYRASKEKFDTETLAEFHKTVNEFRDKGEDNRIRREALENLREVEELINHPQIQQICYNDYQETFDWLLKQVPLDIATLNNRNKDLDQHLKEKIDYYKNTKAWLISQLSDQPVLKIDEITNDRMENVNSNLANFSTENLNEKIKNYVDILNQINNEYLNDTELTEYILSQDEGVQHYFSNLMTSVPEDLNYLQNNNAVSENISESISRFEAYEQTLGWLQQMKEAQQHEQASRAFTL